MLKSDLKSYNKIINQLFKMSVSPLVLVEDKVTKLINTKIQNEKQHEKTMCGDLNNTIQSILKNPFVGERTISPFYRFGGVDISKCVTEIKLMIYINNTTDKIAFNIPSNGSFVKYHIDGIIIYDKTIKYNFY